LGGAGDRIRGVVHRGVRRGGVVFGVGEETRVRPVRGVPDDRGHSGFVLGVAIGDIAGCEIRPRLLVLFADTAFESICCRAAGVWYDRPRLGVPPGGFKLAPAPAATLSLPQKAEEISCAF